MTQRIRCRTGWCGLASAGAADAAWQSLRAARASIPHGELGLSQLAKVVEVAPGGHAADARDVGDRSRREARLRLP